MTKTSGTPIKKKPVTKNSLARGHYVDRREDPLATRKDVDELRKMIEQKESRRRRG
jgi:hypothetical protein